MNNDARYRKIKEPGEFYAGDETGYGRFMELRERCQFWDKLAYHLRPRIGFGSFTRSALSDTFVSVPGLVQMSSARSIRTKPIQKSIWRASAPNISCTSTPPRGSLASQRPRGLRISWTRRS